MSKRADNSIWVRMCAALVTTLLVATWPATSLAAGDDADYMQSPVQRSAAAPASTRSSSKFQFMFGAPARWQGTLHWRYNHTNAPAAYSANKDAVIAQLTAESRKWTAVCGVEIAYDGETNAAPMALIAGAPDGVNVIGWQKPVMGISGDTYSWYQSIGPDLALVDSDMELDPAYVTTSDQMMRTVSHEWGHMIGLAHSNVEKTLMSGPPDSMYTNYPDLAADDVHGCRCLYGPPAGQQAGNICSLPETIDFGSVAIGATSSESAVIVTNSGNGALVIAGIHTGGSEFVIGANGCTPGLTLASEASCTFGVAARPASAGDRTDEVTIDTSEGPYRFPLDAKAVAAKQPPALNFEGVWQNAPAGSESGWGISLAHQGDVIFATWFTYNADGKTWWISMTANRTTDNVFTGTLYETRGPAINAATFDPSAVSYNAVGLGTLTFSDANNGSFVYTVNGTTRTKPITRMVFGTLPVCTSGSSSNLAAATNYQDVWWAPAGVGESGWGVNFTHQGDVIFATWFTYDLDGTPLWLSATAPKIATGVYSGALVRTTGPAYNAVLFDSQSVMRTPVGTLTLTFGDGDHATFAYAVTLGTPPETVTQTKQLTRLVFRAPGTVCQ
jgi:hypothetical protein